MSKIPQEEEKEQKMKEEKENDKNLQNQIKSLLKCDICHINFDLNIHIPMVAKCGHSFCKKCIYNGGIRSSYGICPIDNIHHVLGIESCIPNLKLESIIKKIFNYTEPKITEKKIICFKNEIKLKNNSVEKIDNEKVFRSSSGNKNFFCHPDEIFPNVLTDKKNKTITNFNTNKEKHNINLNNNDNVDVIEELNVINDDKINFTEENKINDESIDTIPLNDDKSNANISFKDDINELLIKNPDNFKKFSPKVNKNINNEYNNNKNDNNKDGIYINKDDNKIDEKEENENNNLDSIKPDKEKINNEFEKKNIIEKNNKDENNNKDNNENNHLIVHKNKIIQLYDLKRNSINYLQNKNKDKIDGIGKLEPILSRPNTITISKNIKLEQNISKKDKDSKNNNIINKEIEEKEIEEKEKDKKKKNYQKIEFNKLLIYDKILLNKRKTISQENNDRNKVNINIKNKSEEKENINLNIKDNKKIKKNNENNNNVSDIYIEKENKNNFDKKYRILSKKIGLKKHPEYIINRNNSNSNSNYNSPSNRYNSNDALNISDKEKFKFCKPSMKNSALNNYCRANILLSNIGKRNENENKINIETNELPSFHKKKYINNNLKYINFNSSNSCHKTNSTYNKKKLKGKSNLFLSVKNNYNISLNNSNNNLNSTNKITTNSNITNIKQLMTHSNIKNDLNNLNRVKNNKISLSMSPNNKDNCQNILIPIFSEFSDNKKSYYKNDIHSTRDLINHNKNFNLCSKDFNGTIKTITIKRMNSSGTQQLGNEIKKIDEKNNLYDKEDINEIKDKLRFEFNRVFNYQIEFYENIKATKNKQILLNRSKKYKSILEEYILNENDYEELKITKIYFLSEGELFIGKKELNLPKYGILYNLNGDYYKGEFENGKKEGNGIMIYKNGTKYEGTFKNNKHDGFGKLIQLDGETFTGEWKEGKINGKGIRCHCNGDKYIGSYVNNIRNGHGNYTFSNGDSYEGNWINGKATGKGVFRFKNGDLYEGEFKENIIMGQGRFKTKNGNIYNGVFKNGLINGKGVLTYENGEKYIGFFLNGKKNGIGKMLDKNGRVFKSGYWKSDKYLGNKYI